MERNRFTDPLIKPYYDWKSRRRVDREVNLIQVEDVLTHPITDQQRIEKQEQLRDRQNFIHVLASFFPFYELVARYFILSQMHDQALGTIADLTGEELDEMILCTARKRQIKLQSQLK